MKILFISSNSEIRELVRDNINSVSLGAEIKIIDKFEDTKINYESFYFSIFDISNITDFKNKELLKMVNEISETNLPALIISNKLQHEFTIKLCKKFTKTSDFLLADNINSELETRIKIIIDKINSLIPANCIRVSDLILDLDKYELKINNNKIELTFKEYELLKLLLENQDKVFSRTKLLSAVWGYDFYGGSRTVDVHMRRLRSKLVLPYCNMLKTVRNVGYMFSK